MMHKHRIPQFAALLLALAFVSPDVWAQGANIDEASAAELKTAKAAYDLGLEAMAAEKYGDALELFKQSYATVSSPNSRLMVGRALVKLGKLTEAYVELRRTYQQAKDLSATQSKYQKTMASAQSDLDDLKSKLSYVVVQKGTTAKIQGTTLGPSTDDETVPVMPGEVSIEATFADGTTESKAITISPGKKFDLKPKERVASSKASSKAPDDESSRAAESSDKDGSDISRQKLGYIVGGVGAVGVVTFVGVGLIGASVYGDTKANCKPSSGCSTAAVDNQGRKSLLQGIGYSGLVMGITGLAIGGWLVFGGDEKASATTAIGVGPGMVQVNHWF